MGYVTIIETAKNIGDLWLLFKLKSKYGINIRIYLMINME